MGLPCQIAGRGRAGLPAGHGDPLIVQHQLDARHIAEHRVARGGHAAVTFRAVAQQTDALCRRLGPGKHIARADTLTGPHGQPGIHGIHEVKQRIAADIAEHGLDSPRFFMRLRTSPVSR